MVGTYRLVLGLSLVLAGCSGGVSETPGAGGGGGSTLDFVTRALPAGVAGIAYEARLEASGGTGPYVFVSGADGLPPGVRIVGSGLSGTPTVPGVFPVSLRVLDATGAMRDRGFSLEIGAEGSLLVSTTGLPSGKVGRMFDSTLAAVGGTAPYAFAIIAGALPDGLELSGARIGGVPSAAGAQVITAQVTDSSQPPLRASREIDLIIEDREPLGLEPASLMRATLSEAYDVGFVATGGNTPYTFSVISGSLPPGLAIVGARLQGAPTAAGTFAMVIELTDGSVPPLSLRRTYELVVEAPLNLVGGPSAEATVGVEYTASFSAEGGEAPYTFSLVAGTMPAGISFDAGRGRLSGVPAQAGAYPLTVRVRDARGESDDGSYVLSVTSRQGGNEPVPIIVPSVTEGVAPLAVFFDATGTTCPGVERPFHHIDYSWDYGDANSRYPRGAGAVGAHVYERPGRYMARLVTVDGDGRASSAVVQIDVLDPDVYFEGESTICVSASGDFSGAPAGALRVRSASFDGAMGRLAAGKRILFRRGETFAAVTSRSLNHDTVRIGAYGPIDGADQRGIADNSPRVTVDVGSQPFLTVGARNMAISNLHFDMRGSGVFCGGGRALDNVLFCHLRLTGAVAGFSFSPFTSRHFGTPFYDCVFWWCCDMREGQSYRVYAGGTRLSWIGCYFGGVAVEHCLRVPLAQKAVISHNEIEAPDEVSTHSIKLHGFYEQATYHVVIHRNEITSRGNNWIVSVGPQNTTEPEMVRDILCDANSVQVTMGTQVAFQVAGPLITVRNNVVTANATGGAGTLAGVAVGSRGDGPIPDDVEVYHNTIYAPSQASVGTLVMASVGNGDRVRVKNNIVFNHGRRSVATTARVAIDEASNLVGVDPTFVDARTLDFRLSAGSPALDTGVRLPVMKDALGAQRPRETAADIGAYEGAH